MPLAFEPYHRDRSQKLLPLTDAHKVSMANIIMAWSAVDALCEDLICQLAKSPLLLGQALTEDLGPDHRLKALKRLCRSWELALASIHPRASHLQDRIEEVRALANWVAISKDARNRLVHWQWRSKDEEILVGFKYSYKPPPSDYEVSTPYVSVTVKQLSQFLIEINKKANELAAAQKALARLPAWPRK